MGACFALTFDRLLLTYTNLHQFTFDFDQILINNVQNYKIHVNKKHERYFLRNALRGTPQRRKGLVNDVDDIIDVNDVIVINLCNLH